MEYKFLFLALKINNTCISSIQLAISYTFVGFGREPTDTVAVISTSLVPASSFIAIIIVKCT